MLTALAPRPAVQGICNAEYELPFSGADGSFESGMAQGVRWLLGQLSHLAQLKRVRLGAGALMGRCVEDVEAFEELRRRLAERGVEVLQDGQPAEEAAVEQRWQEQQPQRQRQKESSDAEITRDASPLEYRTAEQGSGGRADGSSGQTDGGGVAITSPLCPVQEQQMEEEAVTRGVEDMHLAPDQQQEQQLSEQQQHSRNRRRVAQGSRAEEQAPLPGSRAAFSRHLLLEASAGSGVVAAASDAYGDTPQHVLPVAQRMMARSGALPAQVAQMLRRRPAAAGLCHGADMTAEAVGVLGQPRATEPEEFDMLRGDAAPPAQLQRKRAAAGDSGGSGRRKQQRPGRKGRRTADGIVDLTDEGRRAAEAAASGSDSERHLVGKEVREYSSRFKAAMTDRQHCRGGSQPQPLEQGPQQQGYMARLSAQLRDAEQRQAAQEVDLTGD